MLIGAFPGRGFPDRAWPDRAWPGTGIAVIEPVRGGYYIAMPKLKKKDEEEEEVMALFAVARVKNKTRG